MKLPFAALALAMLLLLPVALALASRSPGLAMNAKTAAAGDNPAHARLRRYPRRTTTTTTAMATTTTEHLRRTAGEEEGGPFGQLGAGVWTTRGAGFAFHVDAANGTVTPYEETAISCVRNDALLSAVAQVDGSGDVANMTVYRYVPHFVLDRTDDFLAGCAAGPPTPIVGDADYVRDALVDFDILNQTFVEHYPFFQLHGVDWEALTSEARANLTSDSSDAELFEAFEYVLAPLDDYHVAIRLDGFGADASFVSHPMRIVGQLEEEFEQQDAIQDLDTYMEAQFAAWRRIVAGYMDGDGLIEESSGLVWGRFNGTNVGYMQLRSVPWAVSPFLEEADAAFVALQDTDAIVLDVRVNQGGSDRGALFLASHFTAEPFLAFTKRMEGVEEEMEVWVEPGEPASRYDGELIVIVSGSSYSATETLVLTLAELPRATLLGRNSGGAFTDVPKMLPNGWAFGLTNEEYVSVDGMVYEKVGIPPDITPEAELLPLSEREEGVDSWLELALETAENLSTATPSSDSAAAELHLMSYWVLTPLLLAVSIMLAVSD